MSHQCRLEQRSVIKFLVKQGATPIACWRQLQEVYGPDRALGKTQTRAWHKTFHQGDLDTGTKDQPRSGHVRSGHIQNNIQVIQQQVDQDRRQSIREISAHTGISHSTVQRVLHKDLKLRHVSSQVRPSHPYSRTEGFPCPDMPATLGQVQPRRDRLPAEDSHRG